MPLPINPALEFGGIPVRVSKLVPAGEIWLVTTTRKQHEIMCHEGPKAGQIIEDWMAGVQIFRMINLGEEPKKFEFEFPKFRL